MKDLIKKDEISVRKGDVIEGYESILRLASMRINVTFGYTIATVYKQMTSVVQDFDNLKMSLQKEYGKEKEVDGKKMIDFGENDQTVRNKISKFLQEETHFYTPRLKVSDLQIDLEPQIIADLYWLFTK
ncbi:MAG TPA: hypothetical protein PKW49_05230 [Paludibacteraceae bacterium]|nr:hypothetical protein [Paludibacteraceae bacterium]HPM74305.1 hypothetical protein [Saccharofermentans sp.]